MPPRSPITVSAARLAIALAMLRTASAVHGQIDVYFVDDDALPGGDGRWWDSAFNDLRDALDAARHKEAGESQIRIAQGTYHPDRGTGDRAAAFEASVNSAGVLRLFGGYAGIQAENPDQRDPQQFVTILSGDLSGDDVGTLKHAADNSSNVVRAEGSGRVCLDGITITGGNADGVFSSWGAGLYIPWGPLELSSCRFRLNQAPGGEGGAVFALGPSVTVRSCVLERNLATNGGAILVESDDIRIANSRFLVNTVNGNGGAILASGSTAFIVNSEFNSNHAGWVGGAICALDGMAAVEVTIWNSTSNEGAAAVWNEGGEGTILNSILWDSQSPYGETIMGVDRIQGCCLDLDWPDWGNIGADPVFVDERGPDKFKGTGDEDLRLSPESPCIDAASNSDLPDDWLDLDGDDDVVEALPLDLEGNPRRADDPWTPDTGVGLAPVVDMGAYEFQPNLCTADCDTSTGKGVLDLFDYLCFMGRFAAGDLKADLDQSTGPGVLDLFDFLAFQNAFEAGC